MAYQEETRVETCGHCLAVNHLMIAYSGDSRANERESADCHACGAKIANEECWVILAAASAEDALAALRRIQNRT